MSLLITHYLYSFVREVTKGDNMVYLAILSFIYSLNLYANDLTGTIPNKIIVEKREGQYFVNANCGEKKVTNAFGNQGDKTELDALKTIYIQCNFTNMTREQLRKEAKIFANLNLSKEENVSTIDNPKSKNTLPLTNQNSDKKAELEALERELKALGL